MKKSLQNRKITLTARVILILLLITSALSFAGCRQLDKYVYFASDNISGGPDPHLIKQAHVSIEKTEFCDSDISVNLYMAMHKLSFLGQVKTNPKEQLPNLFWKYEFSLSINICKESEEDNYESVELKKISDEELFSKKYGYIDTPFFINNGVTYMHREKITIPKEYFYKDYGNVLIELELFQYLEEAGEYYSCITYTFTLKYKNVNGKIVLSGYSASI